MHSFYYITFIFQHSKSLKSLIQKFVVKFKREIVSKKMRIIISFFSYVYDDDCVMLWLSRSIIKSMIKKIMLHSYK